MQFNTFGLPELIATIAVVMNVAGYLMKTMVPLRILAIITNCLFITYAILMSVLPMLALNLILLPINSFRLFQMKRMIRQVAQASAGDLSLDWLRPFTSTRRFEAGTVLFQRGEPAAEMFFIVSGRYRVAGVDVALGPGTVVGELGLLAPGRARTQTVECVESGEALTITYEHVTELYYSNPGFGFYFLQLCTSRLFDTIRKLEAENAELRTAVAASKA